MARDVTIGVFARLKAQPGKEAQMEQFLQDAKPLVDDEPGTVSWFAIKLGDGEYGIFDVFPDEQGRQAHMEGQVVQLLGERGPEILGGEPQISFFEVVAAKL